jgi:hypothetical protein
MDTSKIINELRAERDRLNQAIAALEALNTSFRPATRSLHSTGEPAPRKRQSATMKKIWAARKAAQPQATVKEAAANQIAPKQAKRGGLTAAGRKRLSENMRKRWAERKKKAAKAA